MSQTGPNDQVIHYAVAECESVNQSLKTCLPLICGVKGKEIGYGRGSNVHYARREAALEALHYLRAHTRIDWEAIFNYAISHTKPWAN
jgi:Double-stranded RNA binding motif